MKGSAPKPLEPGRKEPSFPAWLLRYATQATQAPLANPTIDDLKTSYELSYSELDHFDEINSSESGESEPPAEVNKAE